MEGLIFAMVVNKFFSWLLTPSEEVEIEDYRDTQTYMNWKYGIGR
jgi:hypothetical protein